MTLCVFAEAVACVLGLVVLALLAAMSGAREAAAPDDYGNIVETTSGWLVVALLPLLIALGVQEMVERRPAPRDHFAD